MSTHKPSNLARHKVDKKAAHQRKMARRKMYKGLREDPRSGYKMARTKHR